MDKVAVIIPCFNEERRLDLRHCRALLDDAAVHLLFVDDGSTDGTRRLVMGFASEHPGRTGLLRLDVNQGKAEAVRQGLLEAVPEFPYVGYVDADFAAPPEEILRLIRAIRRRGAPVVMGSRVRLSGTNIQRRPLRHYLGRVMATAASLVLGLPIYDTQCGAKLFRVSPVLRRALADRFLSRWLFDIELIGRLSRGHDGQEAYAPEDFLEVPLRTWINVPGSKVTPWAMLAAVFQLAQIGLVLRFSRGPRPFPRGQRQAGL